MNTMLQSQMDSEVESSRQEIADELARAQTALQRASSLDEQTDALTRVERENLSIPQGRLKSVQNQLPDPSDDLDVELEN